MGRLIDIEDIVICGWYMEDDDGETYIKLSDVEKCIDKAPTAYDVEAVVRQLEELETCTWKNCRWECGKQGSCLKCMVTQAIEIVKRGWTE